MSVAFGVFIVFLMALYTLLTCFLLFTGIDWVHAKVDAYMHRRYYEKLQQLHQSDDKPDLTHALDDADQISTDSPEHHTD